MLNVFTGITGVLTILPKGDSLVAQTEILVRRGQLVAVLVANAVLWVAAIIVIGNPLMGGPAAIALISIGSLFFARPKNS
jgi:hypothetical protein